MTYEELNELLNCHRKLARSNDFVCGYLDGEPIGNTEKLLKLRSEYKKLHEWFINFLNSVDDLYIKALLYKRYDKGFSWVKISLSEGGLATDECYRKTVRRYLEKVAPLVPPYGE